MNEETKKRQILPVLLLILLLCGLAACAAGAFRLAVLEHRRNEELSELLRRKEMELAVRSVESRQRQLREEASEDRERQERELRSELRASFLERDQRELFSLVNPWNGISPDYVPHLTDLGDGMVLDERCAGALEKMLADCRRAGGFPVPISAYRTQAYQQELFDNKVARVIAAGTDPELAPSKAAQSVAVPGTSEHQLGLAVDIVDEVYPGLDWQQEWTGTQQWLMAHCADYGFILRYPNDTGDITGIVFEPWHYRYVGVTAAKEITELGITFEEYLAYTA